MPEPIRVLHVLGRLAPGGVEVWLRHLARRIDPSEVRMDFAVLNAEPGPYEDELRALGCRILRCPGHRNPVAWSRRFRLLLREAGPFDVVHSHVHHFSGVVLRAARREEMARRIAHAHLAQPPGRPLYEAAMRWALRRYASDRLACSEAAGRSLFGTLPFQALPYGIDLTPFANPSREARIELGVAPEALLVGHVGRMVHQKNHAFLVEVFAHLHRREPGARLLLVGGGPLSGEIETQIDRLGLGAAVTRLGTRNDVPRLLAAMDLLLFPSHNEGLGIALVEAQAAGVPVLYSEAVPREAVVVPELMHAKSLGNGPEAWAEAAHRLASLPKPDPEAARLAVAESPFAIERSAEALVGVYRSGSGSR